MVSYWPHAVLLMTGPIAAVLANDASGSHADTRPREHSSEMESES